MKKLLLLLIVCCSLFGVAHSQQYASIKSTNLYYYFNHYYRLSNTVPASKDAFIEMTGDSLNIFLNDTTALFYTDFKFTSIKYSNGVRVWLGTARDEDGVPIKVRYEMDGETPKFLSTYRNNVKTEYSLKSFF